MAPERGPVTGDEADKEFIDNNALVYPLPNVNLTQNLTEA